MDPGQFAQLLAQIGEKIDAKLDAKLKPITDSLAELKVRAHAAVGFLCGGLRDKLRCFVTIGAECCFSCTRKCNCSQFKRRSTLKW